MMTCLIKKNIEGNNLYALFNNVKPAEQCLRKPQIRLEYPQQLMWLAMIYSITYSTIYSIGGIHCIKACLTLTNDHLLLEQMINIPNVRIAAKGICFQGNTSNNKQHHADLPDHYGTTREDDRRLENAVHQSAVKGIVYGDSPKLCSVTKLHVSLTCLCCKGGRVVRSCCLAAVYSGGMRVPLPGCMRDEAVTLASRFPVFCKFWDICQQKPY